ncbi:MAG: hypothetical protein QOD06_1580 [Candidatus Binatota bacterium]|nr:hypothetical protein [Candidatus Binatota bacterium]
MTPSPAAYLHPVLAVIALLCAGYAGVLGLRGRGRPRRNDLVRHARIAPVAWVLMMASWAAGIASVYRWRSDLEPAGTAHFWLGTAIVVLFTASAASQRWIEHPRVRAIHPWFGALALVLCGFQVFLGLGIMP